MNKFKIYKLCSAVLIILSSFSIAMAQTISNCEVNTVMTDTVIQIPINPTINTISPPPPPPQDVNRKIIWVHGMGGNYGSWEKAMTFRYDTYEGINYAVSYDGFTSVSGAGSHVEGDIANNIDDTENYKQHFIIAHSFGGLVSRELDRHYDQSNTKYDDRPYGGMVTFGTPNLGSHLAYLKVNDEDKIKSFIEDGCSSLGQGIASDIESEFSFLLRNLILPLINIDLGEIVEDFVENQACPSLAGLTIDFLDNKFSTALATDIVPNSQFLTSVSNYPNIKNEQGSLAKERHIAFYGVEEDDDDLFFRLVYSSQKNVNTYPLWGADALDQEASDAAQEVLDEYVSKVEYWDRPYQDLKDNFFPCNWWYGQFVCSYEVKEWRDNYQAGVDWFNRVNDNWKTLIGARTYQSDQLVGCDCYQSDGSDGPFGGPPIDYQFVPIGTYNDCTEAESNLPGSNWTCWERRRGIYTEQPSDGLVTAESAKELPNRQRDVKMDGSNHFQMRNDMQAKFKLKALFRGDYSPENYFELKEQ